MRADLRRFADEGRVEMDDRAAARPHAFRRMGEKDFRRRALPLRIGGREMLADVALGQRAVERVGERVQADVGVGMAAERCRMRDANAAQPYVVAGREGVNVEALADPRLARARREPRLGCAQILHGGHLDVGGVAFEHISRRAGPFGDRDVVGEVADPGGGGAPMRRENEREAEGLRRLHGPQRRARRGRENSALDVDLLDGVAHRRSRRRRPMALGGVDRARNEVYRGEGARRVVDEHDIRLRWREGLEPGQNALLAGRAPDRRRPKRRSGARRQMPDRLVIERAIRQRGSPRLSPERKACGKRLERMDDERAAGAIEILLRPIRAEPHAPAAGDDEKPNLDSTTIEAPTISRERLFLRGSGGVNAGGRERPS